MTDVIRRIKHKTPSLPPYAGWPVRLLPSPMVKRLREARVAKEYGPSPLLKILPLLQYRVLFERIVTPRFTKDLDELSDYTMNIRRDITDAMLNDMMAEDAARQEQA